MKKAIYALAVSLLAVGGIVFANRESKTAIPSGVNPKLPTAAETQSARKAWEASPDGVKYMHWEGSPAGQKVLAAAEKVRPHTLDSSSMEAVVTTLSLPPETRLGFAVQVKMDGADYFLSFDVDDQLPQLKSLKANDRIRIKVRSVSWAPKYAFPILSGNYVERNGTVLYKRARRTGGC